MLLSLRRDLPAFKNSSYAVFSPKLSGRSLRDLALKEISLEKGMLSPFTPGKRVSPLQTLSVAPKRGHTTSFLLYIPIISHQIEIYLMPLIWRLSSAAPKRHECNTKGKK